MADPAVRVLITHLAYTFGGAERTTLNVLNGLRDGGGFHTTLLAPRSMRHYWSDAVDVYLDADPLGLAGWFESPSRLTRDADELSGAIAANRPTVVVGMMHYLAVVAERAVRRQRLAAKVVGSFRGPVFEHLRAYEPSLLRRWLIQWQLFRSARGMFAITVPGAGTRDELLRHHIGRTDRITVIPNGIDHQDFVLRAKAELTLPPKVSAGEFVLGLGRLSVEKRFDDLLRAYAGAKISWPLVLVGDGPARLALMNLASDLGIRERVYFVGSTVFPERWMYRAGMFVHTCQYEGFGYTVLEAAALGIPIVATDCRYGPREVLGDYPFLVPPRSFESLSAAMARLQCDKDLRAQTAQALRRRAAAFPLLESQRMHRNLLLAAARNRPLTD